MEESVSIRRILEESSFTVDESSFLYLNWAEAGASTGGLADKQAAWTGLLEFKKDGLIDDLGKTNGWHGVPGAPLETVAGGGWVMNNCLMMF